MAARIELRLTGIARLIEAIATLTLFRDEERDKRRAEVDKKYGEALQEKARAKALELENLKALVELYIQIGVGDEGIRKILDNDQVLENTTKAIGVLKERQADGSITLSLEKRHQAPPSG